MQEEVSRHSTLTIRTVSASDAPVIAKIYVDSWNAGFSDLMPVRSVDSKLIERWRNDLVAPIPHRWWVCEIESSVVGFVGIGPSRDPIDPDLGEIDTIAVDPNYWRIGVGQELMSKALEFLEADGYSKAVVWTLEHYERGQRFYEEMGWQRDGGVRDDGREIRYRRSFVKHC